MGAQTPIAGTAVRTPGRVLVVVDHPVLAEVVKLALNHGRLHTEVVATAEEALAAVAQRRPHLAVIDMDLAHAHMLDQLGHTLPGTARLPVVALTRRGDLKTKLAPGAHETVDILESLCEQRRQLDRQAQMHFWLHSWLWLHLPLSVALVVLMLIHVWFALKYW